ncbi:hypothetical protein HO133_009119 [Letharia lupina]|uniref:Meiotic recombination protein dmc1 n=1 Tax=Letharia lupina TaxID=560253 RepID=A0A8H6CMP9_9LECA|nr:uncharacterized protein HO133_009119 [Letharia lupina]KAF6226253.1 hypothetical protein HO133_009119 [Letharia lupina]
MSSAYGAPGPGGFLRPTLPSPPASSFNSPPAGYTILPQPRSTPLKPGSAKESSFIDYVDRKLLEISRRYEKRFNADFEDEAMSGIQGRGYESYGELARDLEGVIDVVWVSGTPSLQTPYLLTIALTSCTCLAPFPFSPRPTFHLLHKLDMAFYSLLQGANAETGEILSGFEGGRGKLSTTEKVRMRSLVERTRVAAVEVAGKGGSVTDTESVAQSSMETEDDFTTDNDEDDIMEEMQVNGNHGRWEMEIARVYEKTIVELGVSLDTSGMGGLG